MVLTVYDIRLLERLAAGLTRFQIAGQLGVADSTVKTRLSRLYRFMGVVNAVEAVARWKDGSWGRGRR